MTMPLSDDQLMGISQSPRQAGVEDVEDLCDEVYRLRKIETVVTNLIKAKGRFHTEIAFNALLKHIKLNKK